MYPFKLKQCIYIIFYMYPFYSNTWTTQKNTCQVRYINKVVEAGRVNHLMDGMDELDQLRQIHQVVMIEMGKSQKGQNVLTMEGTQRVVRALTGGRRWLGRLDVNRHDVSCTLFFKL